MEKLEIKITLDPVNDGALIRDINVKRKDRGALIIATNGESKIADEDEVARILAELSDIGYGEYLGTTTLFVMMNKFKVIRSMDDRYFVGSAIIMRYEGGELYMLEGDEFERARAEFESRLVTVVWQGQEFSALEIS